MNPKITIVTVSYNCKDSIEKTIRSVIGLKYDNIEYIIIDGGSKDGTVDVINNYKNHIDYFVSERDKGIYDAMNKSIMAATGDWIIFMNAGDFFANSGVLDEIVARIEPDSIVVHGDIIKQCNGYYYRDTPTGVERITQSMPVFHQSAFTRMSYHKQHPFNISFRSSGDYNFFYNAYFRDHIKFQYVPITVACFDNTDGMSKDNHSLSMHENLRIWGKENDLLFRFKQECHLAKYRIVMWIKKSFFDEKRNRSAGLNRARRLGRNVQLGDYWEQTHQLE